MDRKTKRNVARINKVLATANPWRISAMLPDPLEQEKKNDRDGVTASAVTIDACDVITSNGALTLVEEGTLTYLDHGYEHRDHWERITPLRNIKGLKRA